MIRHLPPLLLLAGIPALLVVLHGLLAPAIEEQRRRAAYREAAPVLAGLPYDNDPFEERRRVTRDGGEVVLYPARHGGRLVATALAPVRGRGYGGTLELALAVRADGSLAALRTLRHRETPGIGTRALAASHLDHFRDAELLPPGSDPDQVLNAAARFGVDALSGATISSQAIARTVRAALELYSRERPALLRYAEDRAGPATSAPPPAAAPRQDTLQTP